VKRTTGRDYFFVNRGKQQGFIGLLQKITLVRNYSGLYKMMFQFLLFR
jgi:hypothetical protein